MNLSKKVMLADRLLNLPHAIHPFWKGDKIAFANLHRLAICRRDNNAAFKEIADFLLVIMPRKAGNLFCPNRPAPHSEFLQPLLGRILFDLNCSHLFFRGYGDRKEGQLPNLFRLATFVKKEISGKLCWPVSEKPAA